MARECEIVGCTAPVEGFGWCTKHYTRWRRHGDPEHERGDAVERALRGFDERARQRIRDHARRTVVAAHPEEYLHAVLAEADRAPGPVQEGEKS